MQRGDRHLRNAGVQDAVQQSLPQSGLTMEEGVTKHRSEEMNLELEIVPSGFGLANVALCCREGIICPRPGMEHSLYLVGPCYHPRFLWWQCEEKGG